MIRNLNKIYIHNFNPLEYSELCLELISKLQVNVVMSSDSADGSLKQKGYAISCKDNAIYVDAFNGEMLYLALTYINKCALSSRDFLPEELCSDLVFPLREDYINNSNLFIPVWKHTWTPPSWLLDFEEKKASFPKANRPMCWAHRGGGDYYPENSIEAIISSISMGADIMELDFRYTKDKRIVLMHYDTLHQSTDWEYKRGKNGLPESDYLADWTYEELSQLRLKAGRKFRQTAITEYIVPTLEEVLKVCDGRAFFIMDKMNPAEEWPQVYDCICRTGCYEAFAFAYKMPEEMVANLQAQMLEQFGKTGPYFYLRKHAGSLERELISPEHRLAVFDEFSQGKDTAIMTNYVQELVIYIDEHFKGGDKI